ncbi:MAG: hypothetical protein E4H33_01155 [Anaerolineales bacterium]|nr:MAG: hypothetical protein E4H33_01155 [Anaerolineales bacterium]
MATETHLPVKTHPRRVQSSPRKPLLAILALVLASLACVNSDLSLVVKHEEGQVDMLNVLLKRQMYDSWIQVANEINQERAVDFAAAGRSTDTENLLPTKPEDFGELLDPKIYQDQGYTTSSTELGFTATQSLTLDQKRSTDDWSVNIIQNPDHPDQITYRAKIFLDLTDMEGSIFQLRNQPLPDKPNLNPGSASGISGGSFAGLGSLFEGMAADVEEQLAIELWYVQKAMQQSDPIEFTFSIELPGVVVIHQLNGETAGTLDGNRVTLVLDEAALMGNSGKNLVFQVESILTDCKLACTGNNQVWDGKEDGVGCNCICNKGWTMVEGIPECTHCDTICQVSSPDLVIDLESCDTNSCGCQCKEGLEMNNVGTACIDEYDAWVEDQERGELGGPSPQELADLFAALLNPPEDKNINQMPGWLLLTSGERENLLNFLEQLGLAVDRTQLIVEGAPDLTDQRYQQILEEQNRLERIRQIAINKLEDQIEERRNIQKTIIREIAGDSIIAPYLLKIPDWYSKLNQTTKQLATQYVEGQLTDAVKGRIEQEAYGQNPPTLEAAAAELIKQIPQMATQGCVDDYYLYKKFFDENCGANCTGDDADLAHEQALEKLQDNVAPGRINWAKPGQAYDQAFRNLNLDLQNKESQ